MRHSSVFWGVLGFLALAVGCGDTAEGEPGCATGLIDCNGSCVDPATDNTYCGASGDCQGDNAGTTCDSGENCDGGTCALSCESGMIDCNGTCVDPATDNTYCGASGDCQGSNAGTTCASGEACANSICVPSSSLSCTMVSDALGCTNGSIQEIDLGMISATACHNQCPAVMVQNGISSGCWVLALNNSCYCRSGSLATGGTRPGGTCN
jgi:hypothetical protein